MTGPQTYSFGEWLKQRRETLRLTQRELAASVYCSVPMIKKIEADERNPSPELAKLLAISLNIPEPDQIRFIEVARGERPVEGLWPVRLEAVTTSVPVHTTAPLPALATPFVGRTAELAALGERLTDLNCRLLTLTGPGGVGKTRLAIAAAQANQSFFTDGIAFAPLASQTATTTLPDMLARSLRLTISGPVASQVLAYLSERKMLLLLDNCEQLEGNLSWLSELLAVAAGVKILVTSRERLNLTEEWVYAVPELAQAQAVELFVMTSQRVTQNFDAETENPAIHRICQMVENLPLALELAAGWTPLMSCSQIAEHIQRDLDILATDLRNVPERHRSIQAVFEYSWNLLTPDEQNALMRLSVFQGGWQVEEALPVAGADLWLLRRLVAKSLVRAGENNRYDLHELTRQYASKKLTSAGYDLTTYRRHFDTYLALCVQLDAALYTPQGMEAFIPSTDE